MSDDIERPSPESAARPADRSRHRWRVGRWGLMVVLVVTAGLAVVRLASPVDQLADGRGQVEYPLPERDSVSAEWLPDGTPVFVVHDRSGNVHVVQAKGQYGIADVGVSWCQRNRSFYAEWTGTRFRPNGQWAGGPDPAGLITYQHEVTQTGQVRVGAPRERAPRGSHVGSGGNRCELEDGSLDRTVAVDHGWWDQPTMGPVEVREARTEGMVLVRGILVEQTDGTAWLCEELAAIEPPSCGDEGLRLAEQREPKEWAYALEVLARGQWRDGRFRDVLITAVLAEVAAYDGGPPQPPPPDPGDVRVEGDVLIVPAGDIFFPPPPDVVPAGRYTVQLENYGGITHTLRLEANPLWQLTARAGQSVSRTLRLDPGTYRFYCFLPGHRSAGMKLTLRVR